MLLVVQVLNGRNCQAGQPGKRITFYFPFILCAIVNGRKVGAPKALIAVKNYSVSTRLADTLPAFASIISAIVMALPFHTPELFYLSWFGLVPWLWAIHTGSLQRAYYLGLLFGLVLFALTTYWVRDFLHALNPSAVASNWLLASAYWIYAAQIPALLALGVRWLALHHNANGYIVFPLIGTLLFCYFPSLFPADFSTSQIEFPYALQAINITGTPGLQCVLLLCNCLIYQWCKHIYSQSIYTGYLGWLGVALWFLYGYAMLEREPVKNTRLSIGIVQPNYPPSIQVPDPEPGYSKAFSPELELSQLLAAQGAQLIIWPELRHTGFYDNPSVGASINQFTQTNSSYLWIQDLKEYDGKTANLSVLLHGGKVRGEYYKQVLIPFGETLPFSNRPFIQKAAGFIFSGFYTPISTLPPQGEFLVDGISVQAFICYEATDAFYINRQLQQRQQQGQHPALLLFQSNNSWFGNSIQPQLHRATAVLRSIEQGLPSVHVINNGPSTISLPNGKILFSSTQNVRRGYLSTLSFNAHPSPTFFSRYPYVFIAFMIVCLTTYGAILLGRRYYFSPSPATEA